MKILLIDDDPACLNNLKEAIEPAGYECVLFQNPKEGINALQRETFDAIITDFRMPEMNGIELINEIREYNLQIPVIMITGCAYVDDAISALNDGAYAIFRKPLKLGDLIDMLSYIEGEKKRNKFKNFNELNILARKNFRLNRIFETMQNNISCYSPAKIDG